MKKRKLLTILTLVAALFAVSAFFVACDRKPDSGTTITPSEPDEDPHVLSLTITTEPAKTLYRPGETFDSSGMTLEAKWSHLDDEGNNIIEEITPTECEISPDGILSAGTTAITFTYEGASVSQEIEMANVQIVATRLERAELSRWMAPGIQDLAVANIALDYSDGETAYVADYTVSVDGDVLKNPSTWNAAVGIHTVKYEFGDLSEEVSVQVREVKQIIPDKLVKSAELKADPSSYIGKDFIEKPEFKADGKTKSGYSTANSRFKLLYEVASGDIIKYHIYSDTARTCELVLNAGSQYIIDGNDKWLPKKVGDMELGKCFDVSVITVDGDSETKTPHKVDATAYFPGGESETYDGSIVKYVDVSLGEFELKAGDNVIELVVTCDDYTNKWGHKRAPNITTLKVFYSNKCDEHKVHKVSGKKGLCGKKTVVDHYECEKCLRIFMDENAEQLVHNVPQQLTQHVSNEPATCIKKQTCTACGVKFGELAAHKPTGEATCLKRQTCEVCNKELGELGSHKFDSTSCEVENECTFCHTTVPAGHILRVDGIVKSCDRCGVVGYQFDVSDRTHISYQKADGTAFYQGVEDKGTGANDSTMASLGGLDGASWRGSYIRIKFTATEAGTYVLRMRGKSMADDGKGNQDLSKTFEYCVNPDCADTSAYVYKDVTGIVNQSTDLGVGWTNFSNFSVCNLGVVQVRVGENEIVIHDKYGQDGYGRGPDINYFAVERIDYKYSLGAECEVVSLRNGGFDYELGYENGLISNYKKKFVNHIYVRLRVPEDKVSEVGCEFYDVGISEDMLSGGKFDTSTVGEHTEEFTLTKFGKTYNITFKYNVTESAT